MSTPTPTTGTGLNNIFSFIGQSNQTIQLVIIGGLFILVFIGIAIYFKKLRRK
jgi:hypothetical protein